tara:strand:- start:7 stop:186 length:180 start_codon:yes stop_codon:yes gene_type:complete
MILSKDFLSQELLKASDLLHLDQSTGVFVSFLFLGVFISFMPIVVVLSSKDSYFKTRIN